MKRLTALVVGALAGVAANADELGTGFKAWEQRDFATAQTIFGKLADAGNPQAMLMLGEMTGYGEGVPEDLARAERLLGRAAAAGNSDAAASLANVRQRAARKTDIARFAAAGMAPQSLAAFGCVAPAAPKASMTRQEIAAVSAASNEWRQCYGRYGAYLQALPAAPSDVARLMNLDELASARIASDRSAVRAAAAAGAEAAAVAMAYDQWFARTAVNLQNMQDFGPIQSMRRAADNRAIRVNERIVRDVQPPGK